VNEERVNKIVEAVLYEGYLLYPYRPSIKNCQRWTFGGLFPQAYSEEHGSDPFMVQTECIVLAGRNAGLRVKVRFLHLVARLVGKLRSPTLPRDDEPAYDLVESLAVDGDIHHAWQEATEQAIDLGETSLADLVHHPIVQGFAFPAGRQWEPIRDGDGVAVGVLIRNRRPISGVVKVRGTPLGEGAIRLSIQVHNQSVLDGSEVVSRDSAQMQSMASTHTILHVQDGEFISLMGPPDAWREAAAGCKNVGTWPVLAGEEGEGDTLLSSPIILYDHPEVAPESPGDFFDGTEIDEMLALRILTMTDEEKRAMALVDEQARRLLQRTQALTPQQMAGLHGTVRRP
jgi:hydrogenase maturation protease